MNPRDYITCMMSQLTHATEHALASTTKELNLTLLQLAALAELNHDGTLSTADLARLTFVTPQNMSLTISKLAAGGYLTRKSHPTNARIKRLVLTPRGAKVLRRAVARAVVIERAMFSPLSARDQSALKSQLRVCLARIRPLRGRKVSSRAKSRS
ncbi:MAG TPA: MarR family transcriptional regulator [Candidatus Acidoferrales bacterium]